MYDVYGAMCATYREACHVAGLDSPEMLEEEARYYEAVNLIEELKTPLACPCCVSVEMEVSLPW